MGPDFKHFNPAILDSRVYHSYGYVFMKGCRADELVDRLPRDGDGGSAQVGYTVLKPVVGQTGAVGVESVRREALAAGVEVCPVHVTNDFGAIGVEGLVDVIGLGKTAREFEDVGTLRAVGEHRAGSQGI